MYSKLIELKDRSIIKLTGKDCKEFLQGLISNDIYKVNSGEVIYASMLSAKGRFLYDFFIFERENTLFLDVLSLRIDEIVKKFSFYKLKKDVNIQKSEDFAVFYYIGTKIDQLDQLNCDFIFHDPRSLNMGYRIYSSIDNLDKSLLGGDIHEYEFTRIKNKIPESEKDLNYDKSVIVEYGLDNFNAIDYEKGCYIGQELTARTHHLGQVRKKIFFCKFDCQELIEKNSEILQNDSKIGLALSCVKYNNVIYGLIFIRIDDKFNKDEDLTVNNIKIEILD